jgi:hypothetical protein
MRKLAFSVGVTLLVGIIAVVYRTVALAQSEPPQLVFWQDSNTGKVTPDLYMVEYPEYPDRLDRIDWITSADAPWIHYIPEYGGSPIGAFATVSITGTTGYPSGAYEGLLEIKGVIFSEQLHRFFYYVPVRLVVSSHRVYLPVVQRSAN